MAKKINNRHYSNAMPHCFIFLCGQTTDILNKILTGYLEKQNR